MKVGIIGAGFGGLAIGYALAKKSVDVSIIEGDDRPGGLAVGFTNKNWDWTLESHYHHWFTSDNSILNLAKEVGQEVVFEKTMASTFYGGKSYQLDSPLSLVTFPEIPLTERVRTGAVLAYLRYTNNWKNLENITAKEFLFRFTGQKSWDVLWKPLFAKKFGEFADEIPASWFWARVKKRSPSLGYPKGGYLAFSIKLDGLIRKLGGKIAYKTKVERLVKKGDQLEVVTGRGKVYFDKVVSTLPSPLFTKIASTLPENYKNSLKSLKGVGAVNLVLSLNKQFLEDGTYWLNVNDLRFPFLAVVEHTNFMDKKNYNNEHVIYVGNYLPHDHPYFKKEAIDLLREFFPYLTTINPKFNKDWINKAYVFKAPFAQPIIPLGYSKIIPDFKTPVEGLYLCNMQQVYPWDRGTNYAVENGEKVAEMILEGR